MRGNCGLGVQVAVTSQDKASQWEEGVEAEPGKEEAERKPCLDHGSLLPSREKSSGINSKGQAVRKGREQMTLTTIALQPPDGPSATCCSGSAMSLAGLPIRDHYPAPVGEGKRGHVGTRLRGWGNHHDNGGENACGGGSRKQGCQRPGWGHLRGQGHSVEGKHEGRLAGQVFRSKLQGPVRGEGRSGDAISYHLPVDPKKLLTGRQPLSPGGPLYTQSVFCAKAPTQSSYNRGKEAEASWESPSRLDEEALQTPAPPALQGGDRPQNSDGEHPQTPRPGSPEEGGSSAQESGCLTDDEGGLPPESGMSVAFHPVDRIIIYLPTCQPEEEDPGTRDASVQVGVTCEDKATQWKESMKAD
ncbi:UNVERIFIED_CONTAM: hypothetical protein K2H54_014995 [Gekko kuhli]